MNTRAPEGDENFADREVNEITVNPPKLLLLFIMVLRPAREESVALIIAPGKNY